MRERNAVIALQNVMSWVLRAIPRIIIPDPGSYSVAVITQDFES